MTAVNHTQPSLQTNAQKVATNKPTKEPRKAQMGSRQCHHLETYKRGLIKNLIGGIATAGASLLVGWTLLYREDSDHLKGFVSVAHASLGLAYVGLIGHHFYLVKKCILPALTQTNTPPGTVSNESAVKDCNV